VIHPRYGVLDHVPLGIVVLDAERRVVFWNACLEDWTGIGRSQMVGIRLQERFPHLQEPRYVGRLDNLFSGGAPTVFSSQLHPNFIPAPLRSGRLRVQHTVGVGVPTGDGGSHVLLALEDVTNLADAVAARRVAEQRYRSIAEDQTEMIVRWRPDGMRTYANDSYCRTVRMPRDEVIGTSLFASLQESERAELRRIVEGLTPERTVARQETCSRPDGPEGPVAWTAWTHRALFVGADQLGELQSVGRDVTDRKLAEEALKESEERFRTMAETAPAAIFIHDGTALRFANAAAEAASGRPRERLFAEFWEMIHPDSLTLARECVLGRLEGEAGPVRSELCLVRADGEEVWLDLSADRLRLEGRPAVVGVGLDVSQRKQLERFKDGLISLAAHELRNPLTSILNTLEWLTQKQGDLSEADKKLLDVAYRNSVRMARLIDDVLDVEKAESGDLVLNPTKLELGPLVEQAIVASEGYARGLDVRLHLERTVPGALVMADPDRLLQVLANLLSNASKFSPPAATVAITVSRQGAALRVAVRDHGPGIPEDQRSHVFEKFFQVRSKDRRHKGTGLGLAISKSLVERQGGRIGFESAPEQGTTFFFELPEHVEYPADRP
jgi:PAS domain S-box-containing protein